MRAGGKIVGHHNTGRRRLSQMHMAVDAAGRHQQALGVDDISRRPEIGAKHGNLAAADADIAGKRVGCGRYRAAADDGVER